MPNEPEHRVEQEVRYVVLEHADRQGVHFDLMIDVGERLATWKCKQPPETAALASLPCTRIQEHRRSYLDYEGPISRDRGHVKRHDQGVCLIHLRQGDRWELAFRGQRLSGRFVLALVGEEEDAWCLRSFGS